jgi:predicted PhzF superfamily epimerase YddE/YHI9
VTHRHLRALDEHTVRQAAPKGNVWVVDAFSDATHRGNPAGVVLLPRGAFPERERMQAVAARLPLPTTAFVIEQEPGTYRIRWFTPASELNLCGHATIATAGYLYEMGGLRAGARLTFHAATATLRAHRENGFVFLDLPRMDAPPDVPPAGLDAALGVTIHHCGHAIDDLLVLLDSEQTVASLNPDFEALGRIACRGHIVTARSSRPGVDFVSRSFFPALGVNEDQVCVSAHCKLAPFWAERLGKNRLTALQLSQRGGRLMLQVEGDRVHVAGTAVMRGSIPMPQ